MHLYSDHKHTDADMHTNTSMHMLISTWVAIASDTGDRFKSSWDQQYCIAKVLQKIVLYKTIIDRMK